MRIKLVISCLVIAFLAWSCFKVKAPEYRGVENVHITDLSFNSVKLNLTVNIYNPNDIKLVMSGGKVNIKLDEIDFGDIRLDSGFVLPPEELSSFTASTGTTFKGLLTGVIPTIRNLLTKDEISLHLKGHIVARTYGGIPLRIPVIKTEKIKLSQQ